MAATVFRAGLLILLATACGGELVEEKAFTVSAGQATLEWETAIPDGKPGLWLVYDMDTGVSYGVGSTESEPQYHVHGTLTVLVSGNEVYDGPLRMDDDASPTQARGGTVTIGSTQSCSNRGCSIKGRVRLLQIDNVTAGSPLSVRASLPTSGEATTVKSLGMQLRAK